MDSKRLKLLERAYESEISAALFGCGLHMMQTKAALAEAMVKEGYELTHVGRMAYCMTCEGELPNA